jgi:hypothetical protein
LATLCYVASGRRPSSHTIKRILATGPKPTSISRRYPRYSQMDPADRRKAIVQLHSEGWTVTSIAGYLETNRPRVYQMLRRWVGEDMHRLGGGMIYCISILENYSRAILASAVSRSQDLTAYLMVLYAAIRQHGCPEALVSDGGSIFKAKEAVRIYAALGIRKEQIEKRQAWQSYIETHFNVQRRTADWHVAHAETWAELVASHEEFVGKYNYQKHWAHRQRQDGRYSPADVLSGVPGRQHDPATLHRIFYTTRFGRKLDKLGYVRFRHWRIYGERGLMGKHAALWPYGETLLLEFSDEPVAQYRVDYEPDWRHFREISPQQLFETQYRSPRLALWELCEGEWLKVVRVPPPWQGRQRASSVEQLALFAIWLLSRWT